MAVAISSDEGYKPVYGFAPSHWRIIQNYARISATVLLFRSGKEASIPYIERKFPAKPMSFKTKTDPRLGLLIADTPDAIDSVARAGQWMLREHDRREGWFIAYSPLAPDVVRAEFEKAVCPWAAANVVVRADKDPHLPFTSDYDLAAIVRPIQQFRVLPSTLITSKQTDVRPLTSTLKTGSDLFAKDNIKQVSAHLGDRQRGFENIWTQHVRERLNDLLGDERIMHGPQVLYVNADQVSAQSLPYIELGISKTRADKTPEPDTLLAFCPSGRVEVHSWSCAADSHAILQHHAAVGG